MTHLENPNSKVPARHLSVMTQLIVNFSYLLPLLVETIKVFTKFFV